MVAFQPDSVTLTTVAAVALVFTWAFESFPCWILTILCCVGTLAAESAKDRMLEFQSAMDECEKAAATTAAAAAANVKTASSQWTLIRKVDVGTTTATLVEEVEMKKGLSVTDLSAIAEKLHNDEYVLVEAAMAEATA